MRYIASCLLALAYMAAFGDEPSPPDAAAVLERSIAYHDPQERWSTDRFRLLIEETRPDAPPRRTRIEFSNSIQEFEILTRRDGVEIEGLMADPDWECVLTLDGSTEFSEEERDRYRLTCDRLRWLRDYYTYLWGLPMKLRDPGTHLDPQAVADSFQDRPAWKVRVTYDATVGSDTWYFYFEPETFRLIGYRFYHDEAQNDGEYITLEGEIEAGGVKIPRKRSWYTHGDHRHLGDDILLELDVRP